MGEHSAPNVSKVREALFWVVAHRRKVAGALVLVLPAVAHLVPDFPAEEILRALKVYLGA